MEWGGCSDDVVFATRVSARFADAGEKGKTAVSLVNQHNNRLGILVCLFAATFLFNQLFITYVYLILVYKRY